MDFAGPVQHEQQAAADHRAQRTVGLFPLPVFAQLLGKSAPAGSRVFSDQLANRSEIVGRYHSSAISIWPLQHHLPRVWQSRKRNASAFCNFFKRATAAIPAGLLLPDCRQREVTEPDAPAACVPALGQWATI